MKKRILLPILALILIATACEYAPPDRTGYREKKAKVVSIDSIAREVKPEFFYLVSEVVKDGQTIWDRSIEEYGTGYSWDKWIEVNPILQQPRRVWIDTVNMRPYVLIIPGENLLNPNPNWVKPVFTDVTQTVTTMVEKPGMINWKVFIACLFALFLLYIHLMNQKERAHKKNLSEYSTDRSRLIGERNELRKKLFKTENKLPVQLPKNKIVDSSWLLSNYHVGDPISDAYPAIRNLERIYGKKPDLIVQARVTTKAEATIMNFSYSRTANTGLDKVVVYLGWDWDKEKKEWKEVGMVAGPCSNVFTMNPERVKKMSTLFKKIELVDKTVNPIIFLNILNVPYYPKLICDLVIKYHEGNLNEARLAGATIMLPKNDRK